MAKTKLSDTAVITKNQFTSSSEFSQHIEKQAADGHLTCMECVIDFCTRNDIDIEVVSKLISKSLKAKIRTEAEEANLMARKSPKLL